MKIIVIGGGAAGFFGACTAAQTNPDAQVTLLEAGREPLAKVKISGGGRCNVTHACFEPGLLVQHYPRGGKALRGAFTRFQPRDTVEWFKLRGVELKTETDGRMFPTSDRSSTICECLMQTAHDLGVKLWTGAAVQTVTREEMTQQGSQFTVSLRPGQTAQRQNLTCDRLLLATGSNPVGYKIAQHLGHDLVPPVPSLFTFNIRDPRLVDLAGVSVPQAQLKLIIPNGANPDGTNPGGANKPLEQTGPLLITHWGLSGPAVLKLSAWGARALYEANYQAQLTVNWLPQYNLETLRQLLLQVKGQLPRKSVVSNCPVTIPRRLWERLAAIVGIAPDLRWSELSNKLLNQLSQELVRGQYAIAGKGVFKEEFVTCGGVQLNQVDFKTLESRRCPGLYLAGEVLDIDGVTGGFNFQSAWTTGWLAGQAIAR